GRRYDLDRCCLTDRFDLFGRVPLGSSQARPPRATPPCCGLSSTRGTGRRRDVFCSESRNRDCRRLRDPRSDWVVRFRLSVQRRHDRNSLTRPGSDVSLVVGIVDNGFSTSELCGQMTLMVPIQSNMAKNMGAPIGLTKESPVLGVSGLLLVCVGKSG